MDPVPLTYAAAHQHAQTFTKCAHVACSILVNDQVVATVTNTVTDHAEMAALSTLKGYCFEPNQQRETLRLH